jgi:hypothetical protein
VLTNVHAFPGLPHAFRRFEEWTPSRRWDELVVENIEWVLDDDKSAAERDMQIIIEVPIDK